MARTDTLNNFLTDVADSIRTKKGTTDTILASDFDTEIASIETSEDLSNELNTYDSKLTEQNNKLTNITNALVNKGVSGGAEIDYITDCANLFDRYGVSTTTYYTISRLENFKKILFLCKPIGSMYKMFYQASVGTEPIDFNMIDTSSVTTMESCFESITASNLIIDKWDTSNVTNMQSMFIYFGYANQNAGNLNLKNFNTEKVTNMSYMFWNHHYYNPGVLDLSSFKTPSLVDITNMFKNARYLTELDISNFDFSNIKSYSGCFNNCGTSLSSPTIVYVKDEAAQRWILNLSTSDRPSTWNTENVIIKGSNSSYTQLTYIQSSGTQRINTGVIATPNIGFEIDFETSDTFDSSSTARNILGCRNASYYWQDAYQLSTYTTTSDGDVGGVFAFGSSSGNTTYKNIKTSANMSQNTRMTISFKNNVFTDALGNKTTLESSTIDANMPIYLFCLYNNNYSEFSNVKLYSCKFYNGDVLIRDFIPVMRNINNSICLYDKVNNVFYTNSGTGTFSGK